MRKAECHLANCLIAWLIRVCDIVYDASYRHGFSDRQISDLGNGLALDVNEIDIQ